MKAKQPLLFFVFILLGALASTGCGYNSLVSQQEGVDQAWSEVENQLQRRNDLIPNYVQTVKGYAQHEEKVFTAIADARAKLGGAKTVEDKIQSSNELSTALSRLLMVVENYPNLKADQASSGSRTSWPGPRTAWPWPASVTTTR